MRIKEIRYSENRNIGGNMRYGWKQFGATADVDESYENKEYVAARLKAFVQEQLGVTEKPEERVSYEDYEKARLTVARYNKERGL